MTGSDSQPAGETKQTSFLLFCMDNLHFAGPDFETLPPDKCPSDSSRQTFHTDSYFGGFSPNCVFEDIESQFGQVCPPH